MECSFLAELRGYHKLPSIPWRIACDTSESKTTFLGRRISMKNAGILVLLFSIPLAACNTAPSGTGTESTPSKAKPDSGKLTNDKAQNALNTWVGRYAGASMIVVGIRELPQENAAIADLRINNFRFTIDTGYVRMNKECPSCSGTARFSHYSDGRWMLTTLLTSVGGEWKNINIEAR
jgi:hypothetical protein